MDQAEQLRNIIKKSAQAPRPAARVITVTSGKGGVGKSNVSINLAVQLRKMGQRVIIFDADFGLANIEVMFGAIPKHNLSDLIYQGKNIKEIITMGPMDIGFISGGSGIAGLSNLGRDYINYLVQNLAELDAMMEERRIKVEAILPPRTATKKVMDDSTPPKARTLRAVPSTTVSMPCQSNHDQKRAVRMSGTMPCRFQASPTALSADCTGLRAIQ